MNLVCANSQFAVFDDLLPQDEFEQFWAMYRRSEFKSVHAERLRPSFRASDGHPYIGEYVVWTQTAIESLLPPGVSPSALPARFCPTGKAYDTLIDRVRKHALPGCADLVGREGRDWVGILGRLYAYPVGSSITWHSDHLEVTGSFIYYTNPEWNVQWGGELFVADESALGQMTGDYTTLRFDTRHETEVLMRSGTGHYIMPKPNRLVLVGPGSPHKVAKVLPAAGDQMRASFAGFFITAPGVGQLVEQLRPR
ncbi:2OG-Fe(II) oxygenase [Sorangium sp. So ce1151]|uniref:2OG-Fe(II) oxygenase n=1 Tax=Sorangium sp. So ce1151 TaxID=3133332 RepID=UPI003F61E4D4